MSSIYSLEVTEEGGKKQLKFGGDLIINHIDKMAAEVKDALPQPADVTILLDNPSNIDMTFIQLALAVRRSCAEASKAFDIKATVKDDLKELLVKAGLDKDMGL